MMHSFKCSSCGKGLKISFTDASRIPVKIVCPICKAYSIVPKVNVIAPENDRVADNANNLSDATVISGGLSQGLKLIGVLSVDSLSYTLKEGINTIGRQDPQRPSEVDFAVRTEDRLMSRRHFLVKVEADKHGTMFFCLEDAGSRNGTFLNGDRSRSVGPDFIPYLKPGDTILAGRTSFVFNIR